jgi:4-amino-4-deoxy-L-arabinose transferase-like glycosyltransferase
MKSKDINKRPVAKNPVSNTITRGWKNLLDKKEFKYLMFITLLGFLLRLVFILETNSSPFVQHLFSDSKIYNDWAINIYKHGNWFGKEVFFMSPAYPFLLAFIYKIFGESALIVRFLQAVLSSVTIVFIYLSGRELYNKQVGYISSIIAAVYSLFIFYSGLILSETIQTFLISVLIFLLARISAGNNKKDWLYIGITIGLAAVIRANVLLFLFVLVCWFIFKLFNEKNKDHIKKSLLYLVIGAIIPILPVTINNYIAKKDFVLLTSNGGINFYLGSNPNSQGVFVAPTDFDFNTDMSGQNYAEKILNRKLLPSEASSYWYKRGLDNIVNDPVKSVGLFINKIFLFFGANENPQSTVFDDKFYEDNYSKLLQLPLVKFSFISYLALLGLILSLREKEKKNLVYFFLLSYTLASIIFFVNGRYRLALTPLLIVIAASAIFKIYNYIKENSIKRLFIPAASVAGFILIYNFLIPKPTFSNYDAYQYLGSIDYDNKDYNSAIINYNKSLSFKDYYLTYFNLGNAFAAKKDYKSAVVAFQKTINRNPNYAPGYLNIGILQSETGNYPMAEKAFLKAIEIKSDFAEPYRNVAIVYYIQENYKESLKYFEKYLQFSNDETVNRTVMQDIDNIKTRLNR